MYREEVQRDQETFVQMAKSGGTHGKMEHGTWGMLGLVEKMCGFTPDV